ncbi:MAG TPA: sterol desaturase, partial [Flavobacterium sp.]
ESYDKIFVLSLVILTLINCGALLEQRKWIYYLEYARLAMISTYFLYEEDLLVFFFVPIAIMIFVEQLFSLSKIYQNTILQLEVAD